MKRAPKARIPLLALSTAALLALACGSALPPGASNDQALVQPTRVHKMPMHDSSTPIPYSAPAGAHLTYYGGRVNANTQVVQVLWGTGSYDTHISSTGTPSVASFYQQFLSKTTLISGYMQQYNTPASGGTGQTFTSGAFSNQFTITPSTGGSTVGDSAIQNEITAQIAAGHLPAPATDAQGNAVTYYALFFPPGITITQGTSSSCVAGGFCAYHGTVASGGGHNEYYYGVHPDMQAGSGCATGCGNSTTFGNYCSVASHELAEMMTDAEVGLAGPIGPPLAWYDSTNGENGDICNAQQGTFAGCDGQSYTYQLEFSNAQNNCVSISPSCGGGTTNDFSIAASPNSLTGSGSSTISTAVTAGTAGTVSLSVSGVPSGASASVSPTSVTAGGSSTLTVNAGSAVAGPYTITVTGTEGTTTHTATVTLTISGGGGGGSITNGGFETGSLSGWTSTGASESVANSGCHGGTYCARLGSTAPTNGDSSIAQTFTAPTGATGLSVWYKETCPDTVTYDWALATLKDNTAGTTATVIAKACITNAWTNATSPLTAGHSYTVTLTSHDDNYTGDPTYTLFDDVTISTGGGGGGGGGITNGGFESGATGWTTAGTNSIATSGCHGGTHCAQAGSTSPTNGDSSFSQTFTVPAGKSQVSVWYKSTCPDSVTYDWVTITLNGTVMVPKTCTTNAWTNITAAVTAGSSYTLTLTSHDDNYAGDPTYTLFDDATLN